VAPSAAATAATMASSRPPRLSRTSWRHRATSRPGRGRPAAGVAAATLAVLLAAAVGRSVLFLSAGAVSPQRRPVEKRGIEHGVSGLPLGLLSAVAPAAAIQERPFVNEILPSDLMDNGAALTEKGEEVFLDSPQLPVPDNAVAASALPQEVGKALASFDVSRASSLIGDAWTEGLDSFWQGVEDGTIQWDFVGAVFFGAAFFANFVYLSWIIAEALFGGPTDEEIREIKMLRQEQFEAQRAAAMRLMEKEAEEDLEISYVPGALRMSPEGKDLDPTVAAQADNLDPDLILPPREEPKKKPPPPVVPKKSA